MRTTASRLGLAAVAVLHLSVALACGKGSDTAPPEAPEGTWRDTECGLLWQADVDGMDYQEGAIANCESLELGGLTWRLPSIGELRCLVNGCEETSIDGECEVNDECTGVGCLTTSCDGCGEAGGELGCYWSSQLGGACGDPLWSASTATEERGWVLHFRDGSISHDDLTESHGVLCVSDG